MGLPAAAQSLGTTSILVGPAAGSNSVVLSASGAWNATPNAFWLHFPGAFTSPSISGSGNANVVFLFDANSGATRSGTLTIAGQTLTVTQAGSTYVPAGTATTLANSQFATPSGVAVDGAGNVFIADSGDNAIKEWSPATGSVTTVVSANLDFPVGVAVGAKGNIFIADTFDNAIKEWVSANSSLVTVISSGLSDPKGVAVDSAGDVYLSDTGNNLLKEQTAGGTLMDLTSTGLSQPAGVAVDAAGNVYVADSGHGVLRELSGNVLTTLVSSGLGLPFGVAVDGSGNVYIADAANHAIVEWTAATGKLTGLISGFGGPDGVAVDLSGNVYIADTANNAILELPRAFVDPTPKVEIAGAGSDALPSVLPVTENLLSLFNPTTDQPWLNITGTANGVVSFSFTANTGPPRVAHINLLGQSIPIEQHAASFLLGTSNLVEGPSGGSDSVILAASGSGMKWNASSQAAWLHLAKQFQSGSGGVNFVFTYDDNEGPTRSGTLTIAGLTLTVTEAGATYSQAGAVTPLLSSGLNSPEGVAVDGSGNVYIADTGNNQIEMLAPGVSRASVLVASNAATPLNLPSGLAVDSGGDVFIADTGDNAIKELPVGGSLTTLVSSGLAMPRGVALYGGNVYIADTGHSAIKELAGIGGVTTLEASNTYTRLFGPSGVAVDAAGNIYIADTTNSEIEEVFVGSTNLSPVVSSANVNNPLCLAVDGSGNVYFETSSPSGILEFVTAAGDGVQLVGSDNPYYGVAVDGVGDLFFADPLDNEIDELPRAFVDTTPVVEGGLAGSDSLAAVVPATANLLYPFTPSSDQPWLTITGTANGIVSFAFTNNGTGENRTAHINLLGRPVSITQDPAPPLATTEPPTSLGPSNATLNASVNPLGSPTTVYFAYGLTTSYGNTNAIIAGNGSNAVLVGASITGLSPATVYHYEAIASNNVGVASGGDITFVTPQVPPSVALVSPTNGSVFIDPAVIQLAAQAFTSAKGTAIQSVSFNASGAAIGKNVVVGITTNAVEGTNFSAVWTNDPPGTCQVSAIATDNLGNRAVSAPANVTVVSVILVNGQSTNTHSFIFAATNSVVVTMTNPFPGGIVRYTTNGSAPINGQVYTGPLTIHSSVVVRAEVIIDGAPSQEAARVSITIVPAASLPVVSITSPTNGASLVATNSFVIQATVQPSKNIRQVNFYMDGQPIGSNLTAAPYNLQIAAGSVAPGGHVLQAIAAVSNGLNGYSALSYFTVNNPGTVLIDFDALNTTAGAVGGTLLSNYLAQYGVTVADATAGTVMNAVNANNAAGNVEVVPSSPPNYFTQAGLDQAVSFTLKFASPLQSFAFTRVGLVPISGMASHPKWTATALDTNGVALGSVSEGLIVSPTAVPLKSFVLPGNGIASVRFDSDSEQTAAFSAVLLDDLVLGFNPVAPSLGISLAASPPASGALTLTASVTNLLSGSSTVSFFEGPNLLVTITRPPYQFVITNLLPGNYTFQASVLDPSGAAAYSSVVPVAVQLGANSALVDFDLLKTSRAPVTGLAVNQYLAGFGMIVTNATAGTALTVYNERQIAGGSAALASSPSNLLTQTGSSGPVQFRLQFTNVLRQFGFTRPGLLANPFVSHPAWQVTAFDGAGTVVDQASETEIDSTTNVGAREFSLSGSGENIATVQFASEGTGLTTFNAMLIDDLVFTTNPPGMTQGFFPLSVAITQPLAGQTLAQPPALTIVANASDTAGVAGVRFYANGVFLGSNGTRPYQYTWENPTPGNYALTAVASSLSGLSANSGAVSIVILPSADQFAISSQPANQTVAAGGNAQFSVTATGTNAITYQWSHNGRQLPGATANPLVVGPPIADSNAGTYSVAVTAGGVTLNSSNAVLTVVDPPVLTVQPVGLSVPAGTDFSLSVAAAGPGPFTYQWLLNRNNILGATNNVYSIASAQPRQSGNYQVVVANLAASVLSAVAPVIVETAITVPETNLDFASRASINPLLGPVSDSNELATVQKGAPLPDGVPGGDSIWFTWTPEFTGTVSLTTQGSDFDTVMAVYTGTQSNALRVVAADDDSGGFLTSLVTFNVMSGDTYQIAVDGSQGASGRVVLGLAAGSGERILNSSTGNSVPLILRGPASQSAAANAPVTLSVAASSPTKISYQWYFQGLPIPGATADALTIAHLSTNTVGSYDVLVDNAAGSAQSEPAILQIEANQGTQIASSGSKLPGTSNSVSPASLATVLRPLALGGDTAGYSASQTFSSVGATSEPGQPEPCGQVGGASEWFAYTTQAAGTLLVDTAGSDFNVVLGVYSGNGESFTNLVSEGCGYTTNYLLQPQPSVMIDVTKGEKFYIMVTGYEGASGTARLQLGLGNPLVIGAVPTNLLVTAGSNATFAVAATGSTPIAYQWQLNGINVPGATKASYTVTKAQAAQEGNYTVTVSNVLGALTSSPPAALALQYAPAIVSGPTNVTVTAGETARLAVTAMGVNVKTNPLVCQWYYADGERVPKAESLALSFPDANVTNSGGYYLVITNSYGSVTSTIATLTVMAKASKAVTPAAYSGLFYPTNGAAQTSAGFFAATVDSTGVFSANILLDGGTYSFSGQLDLSGNAQSIVPRGGRTPVAVSLHVGIGPTPDEISGVVSNAAWVSVLQAGRASGNPQPVPAGTFALAVPPGTNTGFLALTNGPAGTALVTGTLPDGAIIFRTAPVNEDAAIPLYVPLYSGQGLFVGWMTLTNNPASALWIKPGSTNPARVLIVK